MGESREPGTMETLLSEAGKRRANPALRRQVFEELERSLFGIGSVADTIGRYQLCVRLGSGSQGVVHEAWDPKLQRPVAIKLLRERSLGSTARRARLLREALLLAQVDHPNVVQIYDVGEHEGRLFVACELVPGTTLDEWLATPRSRTEIVAVLSDIAAGLAAAHACGVVHRDVKPANVLLDDRARARLTDFGMATAREISVPPDVGATLDNSREPLDPHATGEGVVVGTPAYMAPEQYDAGEAGPSVDQYALCCVAWEALTGTLPFPIAPFASCRDAKRRGPPAIRSNAPNADLLRVLAIGLAPRAENRWASVARLRTELESAVRRRRNAPRRRRLFATLLGVGVAAGLASLIARSPPATELSVDRPINFAQRQELLDVARASLRSVDLPRAAADFAALYSWCDARADADGAAIAAAELVGIALQQGDRAAARSWVRHATAQKAREVGAPAAALVHVATAGMELMGGDPAAATETIASAHALCSAHDCGASSARVDMADGDVRRAKRDYAGAIAAYRRARKHSGNPPRLLALAFDRSGIASAARGSLDAAVGELRAARALREQVFGPRHPQVAESLANLGSVRLRLGDTDAARDLLEQALEIRRERLGPDHPAVADSWLNLGVVSAATGDDAGAATSFARALTIYESTYGESSAKTAGAAFDLGLAEQRRGKLKDAEQHLRRSLGIREEIFGGAHPATASTLHALGVTLAAADQLETAAELFTHAQAIRDRDPSVSAVLRMNTRFELAKVWAAQGRTTAACRAAATAADRLAEEREAAKLLPEIREFIDSRCPAGGGDRRG